MKKIGIVRCMIVGALMSAYAAGAAAQAIEQDADNNYPKAQPLERGADGTMSVKGVIGVSEFFLPIVDDVDLYSFFASEGDVLQIDIDGGIKSSTMFGAPRSVDTTLTILGPDPEYLQRREQATCLAGTDPGSVSPLDPCILNFRVEKSGIYIVAVTANPARVFDGGHVSGSAGSNGEYLLIVSGASEFVAALELKVITIEIKPGSRQFAPINLKSKGSLPVALISSGDFDALKVDRDSLRFGATGDEDSLRKCGWEGENVGGDSKLDLVCHFETQAAEFGPDHTEGVLKGTIDGKPFEGRGVLKVLLGSKKQK
ncbi:MAG: PPC domain-containing protein [Burkholderiales bacterium]